MTEYHFTLTLQNMCQTQATYYNFLLFHSTLMSVKLGRSLPIVVSVLEYDVYYIHVLHKFIIDSIYYILTVGLYNQACTHHKNGALVYTNQAYHNKMDQAKILTLGIHSPTLLYHPESPRAITLSRYQTNAMSKTSCS